MTDIVLPISLRQARSSFKYIDSTGVTRGAYTGVPQTTNYGGDRIGASIDFTSVGGRTSTELSYRAQLQAFMMGLRGKTNRVYLTDSSYTRRGSFPATELFSNTDFNGTTGWTGSNLSIQSSDGSLRATVSTVGTREVQGTPSSVTQYAPYVVRSIYRDGKGLSAISLGPYLYDATQQVFSLATSHGYQIASFVNLDTAPHNCAILSIATNSGYLTGDYIDVTFASMSRCILADGGGNQILRSDEIDNALWTKTNATISAGGTAPDGTSTADAIVENGTNTQHLVTQSGTRTSQVEDLCAYGYFKRNSGTRNIRLHVGSNGSNYSYAIFDLGAGTVGTITNVGTATKARAFIVDAGSGYYYCSIVMRAAASTTIFLQADLNNGTTDSYLGDSTSSVLCWRVGATQSYVPTRGTQTTSAVAASATQTGLAIYVKGLPASTSGLLLQGDWVEIDGQLKMVTSSLDSDAAGLGYLQFSPPLRRAIADNTAIIVHKPMGRFMLGGDSSGWANDPGVFSSATLELEEAFG